MNKNEHHKQWRRRELNLASVHPDDRPLMRAWMESVVSNKKSSDLDNRIVRPNGEVRALHTQAATILDHSGRVLRLVGTSQDFPEVRNYQLSSGQFFTAADVQAERKVAVLGQTVVTNLFSGQDPIGQSIKINRQTFRVVGVLAAKGGSGFSNQDDTVVVPITSAWSYLLGGRNRNVQQIFAEAASANLTSTANTEITQVLLDQQILCGARE